ncbi:polyprenyl synthetase family protein [Streptomyces sp. NPDC051546]|uniref:polyprenyl synthetase family protein n=1 Tax=Streptomyces sp. NPDC051546 TaxID=3365655 RepID=UPI0037B3C013
MSDSAAIPTVGGGAACATGWDLERLKEPVDQLLTAFLEGKTARRAALLPDLAGPLSQFVAAGGKRIRPVLAMVAWHAAGAHGTPRAAHHLAAALELFHAFALIHDDVMDRSDTRRGHPTIHHSQGALHTHRIPAPGRAFPSRAAARFGEGAAILIGDMALIWSDELIHTGGLTPAQLGRILPLLDEMRSEVILGQYLDLEAVLGRPGDVEAALTVIRYKTAKYTIERPLHLGAALAGADQRVLDALSAYAIPLGEAFQLRDDLLGVFGNPAVTGKPALDDLREGKATVLVALAFQSATRVQAQRLRQLLGRPSLTEEQAEAARHIIDDTGARTTVENMITERGEQALAALESAPVEPAALTTLRRLTDTLVRRTA